MRKRTNHYTDSKVFSHTAATSKKININPAPYRGGIRL